MWGFYRPLVRRAFAIFLDKTDRAQNVIGVLFVLLALVTFFNEPIGKWITGTWRGIPQWWGVFPLAFLFVLGFLSAVHEKYEEIEGKLSETQRDLRDLQEQLVPRLRLVFDPEDPQCFFTSSEADAIIRGTEFRVLGLRVENMSASRLDRVRVLVEDLGQAMPFGPQPLQFQRDLQDEPAVGAMGSLAGLTGARGVTRIRFEGLTLHRMRRCT